MNKRRILILGILIGIVALTAGGTIAYFSTSKSVTNTFMITSYDPENPDPTPDDLFSIKVYEHNESGEEVNANEYNNIAPGTTVSKDPTVKNTGEYSAWIRVKVSFSNAASWVNAMEKHNITDLVTLFGGYIDNNWYRPNNEYALNVEEDTLTYTFYYNKALEKSDAVTLFETFTIPGEFDAFDMVSLGFFELKVTADAIQHANTGDSAYYAFNNYWK